MPLSGDQLHRYSRHINLPEVGLEGQQLLLSASVIIVGAGGLGSPVGYYLAAAGVGHIAVVDDDIVELSNLQRQIAHSTDKIGMPKVLSARKTFIALNPGIRIDAIRERIDRGNITGLFEDYDIVADCSDNFETRFLINDACVIMKKRLVSGAVNGFEGQLTTILPGEGHCYRCIFEDMPPPDVIASMQGAGLVGAIPGVIGSLQALEIIKLILGKGQTLKEKLLVFDGLKGEFRYLNINRNSECLVCGDNPKIVSLKA
ncbi:MAG TPA: molybdopterin-synthase adenylyltransferase MoeB [Dissulfurispiraceae bacterium]|nr:molybdopterin-synthase adenylyltransferase MoeB [Dissulfurispiraceae bacterium]